MADDKSNSSQALVEVSQNPSQLLELAVQQNLDIEKLEKLMELQERWEAREARRAFYDALSQFQSVLPVLKKNQTVSYGTGNGAVSYNYANLAEIVQTIKEPLSACGLSYRFEINQIDDNLRVGCIITHRDGHSELTEMSAPLDTSGSKNSVQARGSTTTYLERYTIMGALGIATGDTDDDGQQALRASSSKKTRASQWLNLKPNDPVPSGKHSGKSVRDLPIKYLEHLGTKNPTFREFCKRELERRSKNKPLNRSRPSWKVPEINEFTKVMNPATVKSIMQVRYSTDRPEKLPKQDCENFLAFLQAEKDVREQYNVNPDLARGVIRSRFGQQAEYRELDPAQMEELGAVLKIFPRLDAAQKQIPGKYAFLLADWENATGETVETANKEQIRQLITMLQTNGFDG